VTVSEYCMNNKQVDLSKEKNNHNNEKGSYLEYQRKEISMRTVASASDLPVMPATCK